MGMGILWMGMDRGVRVCHYSGMGVSRWYGYWRASVGHVGKLWWGMNIAGRVCHCNGMGVRK